MNTGVKPGSAAAARLTIVRAGGELEEAKDRFLRAMGYEVSTVPPLCLNLWTKDIDGAKHAFTRDVAFQYANEEFLGICRNGGEAAVGIDPKFTPKQIDARNELYNLGVFTDEQIAYTARKLAKIPPKPDPIESPVGFDGMLFRIIRESIGWTEEGLRGVLVEYDLSVSKLARLFLEADGED